MEDDPIIAEVRKAREEIYKEHGYSMEALFRDLKRTEVEHMSADGRYVTPHDASLKVAEETPGYKIGNGE